jgi:hypothetical protein
MKKAAVARRPRLSAAQAEREGEVILSSLTKIQVLILQRWLPRNA